MPRPRGFQDAGLSMLKLIGHLSRPWYWISFTTWSLFPQQHLLPLFITFPVQSPHPVQPNHPFLKTLQDRFYLHAFVHINPCTSMLPDKLSTLHENTAAISPLWSILISWDRMNNYFLPWLFYWHMSLPQGQTRVGQSRHLGYKTPP